MKKQSAGVLLYRYRFKKIEVLLVHPGGPFWKKKDAGAWTIPKGEFDDTESPRQAAMREFEEETGQPIGGDLILLTPAKQKSGKLVHAWAAEGNLDEKNIRSNLFEMEWPPRSGKQQSFPEVDRAEWFSLEVAKEKIIAGQVSFLDELSSLLTK
ncbi:MAG: NUDIX domain-containing protein [Chitinophagaceae bacterium]|nr:MAG: NUDIX domain-containing protein [Chitinophagaceae bacterium]